MLKQLPLASLVLTGVLILSGCNIDESFSTDSAPTYTTTTSQVTTVNPSVGRSASPTRYGSINNSSNVVTTNQQTTTMTTTQPTRVVTVTPPPSATVVESEPDSETEVRSTPSDVISTNNGGYAGIGTAVIPVDSSR